MAVLDRFLKYVRIDTPSDGENDREVPSSRCQFDLANVLVEELKTMGIGNAFVDEHCYVYAHIPANMEGAPKVGFIAHMDVVNETKGYGVKPQVVEYWGGDIPFPTGGCIAESDFPIIKNFVGERIVTADGTTILGADDKAGIAEIMELCAYLVAHPEVRHGKIGIAFTPDEEIGNGASMFNVEYFDCDFAYTVDGEQLGELCYETFNGAGFTFKIHGKNIHPGSAKGKMVNALVIANEIISAFPESERPETTEGREGYYFFSNMVANVEECTLSGIVRDHDKEIFAKRKEYVNRVYMAVNQKYNGAVELTMRDQYYNCGEVIAPHMYIVEKVAKVMRSLGVEPIIEPIRGGTDGSTLSYKGLPCPNICTGGLNAHGINEMIVVSHMEKVVEILKAIAQEFAN